MKVRKTGCRFQSRLRMTSMFLVERGEECLCFPWHIRSKLQIVVKCGKGGEEGLRLREDVRSDVADGGERRRG